MNAGYWPLVCQNIPIGSPGKKRWDGRDTHTHGGLNSMTACSAQLYLPGVSFTINMIP